MTPPHGNCFPQYCVYFQLEYIIVCMYVHVFALESTISLCLRKLVFEQFCIVLCWETQGFHLFWGSFLQQSICCRFLEHIGSRDSGFTHVCRNDQVLLLLVWSLFSIKVSFFFFCYFPSYKIGAWLFAEGQSFRNLGFMVPVSTLSLGCCGTKILHLTSS